MPAITCSSACLLPGITIVQECDATAGAPHSTAGYQNFFPVFLSSPNQLLLLIQFIALLGWPLIKSLKTPDTLLKFSFMLFKKQEETDRYDKTLPHQSSYCTSLQAVAAK